MGSGNNSMSGGMGRNRFGGMGSMKPMGSGFGNNSGQSNQNWFNGSANTGGNDWSSQFWNPNTSYSSGFAGMGNNGAQPSDYGYNGTGNQGGFDFGNFDFGGMLNNFMSNYGQQDYSTPQGAYDYGMNNVGQGNVGGYTMAPTTQTGNSADTYNPAPTTTTQPYAPDLGDPRLPKPRTDTPTTPTGWQPPALTTYNGFKNMNNRDLRGAIQDLRGQNSWVDEQRQGTGSYSEMNNGDPRRNQFDNKRDYLLAEARYQQQRENTLNSSNPAGWNLTPGSAEWDAYREANGLPYGGTGGLDGSWAAANGYADAAGNWNPGVTATIGPDGIARPTGTGTGQPYAPDLGVTKLPNTRTPFIPNAGDPKQQNVVWSQTGMTNTGAGGLTPGVVPSISPKPTPGFLQGGGGNNGGGGNGGGNNNRQQAVNPFAGSGRR